MPVRQDLFAHVIASLRYGATQEELSEALNECVNRARDTGKAAKLTLTLTLKPNGTSGQYTITDNVSTKLPSLHRGDTLMFGTPDGNLTREDPRQSQLPLRKVADDTAPTTQAPLKRAD